MANINKNKNVIKKSQGAKMEKAKTFFQKVIHLQNNLQIKKENINEFSNYKYRNLENINSRIKPLLLELGLFLYFTDRLVKEGDRYYVESTAILTDGDKEISAVAYAREEQHNKRMNEAQLTGACSSYACTQYRVYFF